MTTFATLEANLTAAQNAYNTALGEIQAARVTADKAVRRHARALQDQIAGEPSDAATAQEQVQVALEELATVEAKYGI